MIGLYKIEGTDNICSYDLEHVTYNTPDTWPTFQEDYERFKNLLIHLVDAKLPKVFMRIGDGELFFLEGQSFGNIGNRHVSNIQALNLNEFREGFLHTDYKMIQLYSHMIEKYKQYFPNNPVDFPLEYAYSIIANRWLFKQFSGRIGIIGSEKKLEIIKKLFEHPEYREYIGMDGFVDYIPVQERFACDDIAGNEIRIGSMLKDSKSDIFIYGIGISKMALAHRFKNYKNAVYLDVGCGISALAGMTSLERPYFGAWKNYRLNDYDYSDVDQMDYRDTAGKNEIIL